MRETLYRTMLHTTLESYRGVVLRLDSMDL